MLSQAGKRKRSKLQLDPARKRYKTYSIIPRAVKAQYLTDQHFFEIGVAGTVSNSGSIDGLLSIAQGDLITNRHGNRVTLTGFDISFSWVIADTTQVCRTIVVLDRRCNGANPTVGDILGNGTTASVYSSYNETNRERFQILYDRTVMLSNTGDLIKGAQYKKRGMNTRVTFASSATNPAIMNGLFLLSISDSAAVAHPTVNALVTSYFQP